MAVRTASYYDPSFQAGKPVGVAMLEQFWNIRSAANEEKYNARLKQLDPAGLRKERIALYAERQNLEQARADILSGIEERRAAAIDNYNKAQVDIFTSRAGLAGKRIEAGQKGYTAERKREAESRAARAISPETRRLLHDKIRDTRDTHDVKARAQEVLGVVNTAMAGETGVLGGGSKLEKFDTLLLEAFIALDGDPQMQIAVMERVRPNQPAKYEVNGEYYPANFPQEYQDRYGVESDVGLQLQAYRHWQKYGVGDPSLMAPVAAGAPIGQNALASINNAILDIDAEMKGLRSLEGRSREEYDALRKEGFDPLAPIRSKAWEGEAMIDRVARLQQIDPDRAEGQFEAARAKYEGKGVPASPLVRRIEQGIRTARGEEIEMPGAFDEEGRGYTTQRLQGIGPAGNMVDYIQTETAAIQGLLEGDEDQKRQAIERAWDLNDTLGNPLVQDQVKAIGGFDNEAGEIFNIAAEFPLWMKDAQAALESGDMNAMYELIADGISEVQGVVSGKIEDNPEIRRLGYLGDTFQEAVSGTLESGQEEDYDAYGQRLSGIQHYMNALPEALRGEAGTAISAEIGRMEEHGDRRYMEARLTDIAGSMGPPSAAGFEMANTRSAQLLARGADAGEAPAVDMSGVRPPGALPTPAAPVMRRPPETVAGGVDIQAYGEPDVDLGERVEGDLPRISAQVTTPGEEAAARETQRGETAAEAQRRQEQVRRGSPLDDEFEFLAQPPPDLRTPPTVEPPLRSGPADIPGGTDVRRPGGRTAYEMGGYEPSTLETIRNRKAYERLPANLRPQPTGVRKRVLDYRAGISAPAPAPQPTTTTTSSLPDFMDPIAPPMNIPPGQSVPETGKDRYGGKYQGVHRRSNVDPGKVISTRWYPEKEIVHQWEQRLNSEGVVLDSTMAKRARSTGGDLEQQMYAELVGTVRSGSR